MKAIRIVIFLLFINFSLMAYFSLNSTLDEVKAKQDGKMVPVILSYIPSNCKSSDIDFKFIYNEKEFHKDNMIKVCRYFEGDTLHLIHSENYENLFFFPEEKPEKGLFNPLSFGFCAILSIIWLLLYRKDT